jgi:hydroxyethylthiazole kinase-like sugar kinase family protein
MTISTLTEEQRQALTDARNQANDLNDPTLYYAVLLDIDPVYAQLALGVVNRGTLAGITAKL